MSNKLKKFQLTPSRRATTVQALDLAPWRISTHALTEGDRVACFNGNFTGISTHALTEGDCAARMFLVWSAVFQLTPSRRATSRSLFLRMANSHFNSRPHGGRHHHDKRPIRTGISTHALTEGDNGFNYLDKLKDISTHALTEGDAVSFCAASICFISTHALTEGDSSATSSLHSMTISTHALTEGDTG